MIQMNLKRKYENNSCTHGILTIPAYQFKCLTLELCNGNKMRCKQDCRINEGSYLLERGYAQGWPSFPVFKKKPSGFFRKPEFNLSADNYMNLPTGDIALGTEMLDGFSIRQSDELAEVFKAIFTFVIPIAFVAYYPSLVLLQPDEVPILTWLSPLIGLVFFFLSYAVWMLGVRKYDFTGS